MLRSIYILPILLTLLPHSVITQCNPGAIYNKDKNKCYQYFKVPLAYTRATSVCATSNGYLVSVHSSADNSYLAQQALQNIDTEDYVWLGARATSSDVTNPMNWQWADKTAFDFQNYQNGQPVSVSPAACMMFHPKTSEWLSTSCNDYYPFICELDPIFSPSNCGSTSLSKTGLNTTSSDGLKQNEVWIGLVYQNDSQWHWTDNSPVNYRNWAKGEPNFLPAEKWTSLMSDAINANYNPNGGEWNNVQELQRAFICKKPIN
ncbi:hypothetical protein B9Z55_010673 [Caenorhabditis nigoni]|uniref:C-type lectin domain-containing protein n=1 Tax=Caenorhabditis nigoni TaxID=1611254 RepID=A0A2G5UGV6_9PELO|nr:hypothetical protein B9Z55_010673 [Caenorhabditis nigoni]